MSRISSAMVLTAEAAALGVGLAAVLVVTLATVAGTAEAAKAQTLKAGVQNAVRAMTSIVGALAEPVLRLDNNGTGAALGLEVQDGGAPLTVNSGAGTATGLSADELDGKSAEAFMPAKIYKVDRDIILDGDGGIVTVGANVECDDGDLALAGAHSGTARDTQVANEFFSSAAGFQDFWGFNFKNFSSQDDPVKLSVNCADLSPTR